MKFLLLLTIVATVYSYAAAGTLKKLLALAALNGGVLPGVNGAVLPGVNGAVLPGVLPGVNRGLLPGLNVGLLPLVNGGLVNGVNPMAGGLNPPMVAGGAAGLMGQPQYAQFVPGAPMFAAAGQPIPYVYSFPALNMQPPANGVPQMAPVNPAQQPQMGFAGGAVPQQVPAQPNVLPRFRRETRVSENALKDNLDAQVPASSGAMTTTAAPPCVSQGNNQV